MIIQMLVLDMMHVCLKYVKLCN